MATLIPSTVFGRRHKRRIAVSRRMGATVLVLVPLCSCAESQPPLPPIIWEGQNLRYRTHEPADAVCAGSFEHLDQRAGYLAELFESTEIVDYSWTPGDQLQAYCSSSLGCARGSEAFSALALHEHELFHAVRARAAYAGIEEGMATFFGDDFRLSTPNGDIRNILRNANTVGEIPTSDYPKLGHFTSYIDAEFGTNALVELDHRSASDDSYSQFEVLVEGIVEVPLTEIISGYELDYPSCGTRAFRHDGFECGMPGVELPGLEDDGIDLEFEVSCSQPDTLGPRNGEIWRNVPLTVFEDSVYEISVWPAQEPIDGSVIFDRCGTSCFEHEDAFGLSAGIVANINPCMRRGTYLLRLTVPEGTVGRFQLLARAVRFADCSD